MNFQKLLDKQLERIKTVGIGGITTNNKHQF